MKSLIKIYVCQLRRQFIGLQNILSKSRQIKTLSMESSHGDENESVSAFNLPRCELPFMRTLILRDVTIKAIALKNLISNASLHHLVMTDCIVTGNEIVNCQVP